MPKCYFELRKQSARGSDSIAADIMRHLHTRQHLGSTLIICDQPVIFLSAARKQWLKISRSVQKQRASTLHADKILKYTHTITHMQRMRFTTKQPMVDPEAEVYFISPNALHMAPMQCYTVYFVAGLSAEKTVLRLLDELPGQALIVDYNQTAAWKGLGLQPKRALEEHLHTAWEDMQRFLADQHINIKELLSGSAHNVEAMDNALDTLLGASDVFLQQASSFQRALELARPLRIPKAIRQQYDTLSLLAHRVQALTSTAFTQRFLEIYNEDDTFFLYDRSKKHLVFTSESLAILIARHEKADRPHLAKALRQFYMGRSLSPTR